ncbi:MAG: low molecular weight protein-tyrosine-phosphatase [Pseudomonadota bacterium]
MKLLFVCTGNICRSPLAQGVVEKLVHERWLGGLVECDSAATHRFHTGSAPDTRSVIVARNRGIDITNQRARPIHKKDFQRFDLIVGMDRANLEVLSQMCPDAYHDRLHLLLDFAPELGVSEVPDPVDGGPQDFEHVLELVETAGRRLVERITPTIRGGAGFS